MERQLIKCVWAYALLDVRRVQLERSRRKNPGQQAADTPQNGPATRGWIAPTGLEHGARELERCNVCGRRNFVRRY